MTKEPIEEARPDKLTAEEAVRLVLKRPGMYGLTRTDEFRKVEAERDAATELAAIKARAEEVNEDEGWHIGGAWGDYGEVVVPLRILSYVVDGALDEKIVSTDPGYAATYAEQVARADHAEAERDAALAAVDRIREAVSGHPECDRYSEDDVISCGWKSAYASVVAALDGAPEPEEGP